MASYEHMTVLPHNEVKCTLCDDIINDSHQLVEAHLHGRRHRELYMKTLMTTNNVTMDASDLFCNICGNNISELVIHVQSSNHQSKLTSIRHLVDSDGGAVVLPEKISNHSSAYCTICDTDVEFMYGSIEYHIFSSTHKRAKAMVLQPMNGIFSVEGSDEYLWCKICQLYFDNYIEIIFQHVEESEHAKKMGKILRLIDGHNIDMWDYLQNHKEDKAFCKKCNIVVPCNVDNLQRHINGKKHNSP